MKPSSRPLSLVALSLALSGSLGLFTQLSQAQTRQAHTVNPLFAAQQSSTFKPGLNRVTFQSGGETLVGNLYLPNNYQAGGKLPAVIISGSWTTVKEQMAADYGQRLSAQGFAAFAYDSRSFGESGGKLRSYESPSNKIVDLKNAVTFLQTVNAVDPNKISALGICAGAGYVVAAAAEDPRIKAVVAIAPWLHDPAIVNTVYGGEAKVNQMIERGRQAKTRFQQTGQGEYLLATSKTDNTAVMFGEIDYYQNPQRGAIPQWDNRFAVATWAEWLTFNPMPTARQINVPTLFIHSEKAAIPQGAKQYFAAIPTQNKQFVWLNNLTQFDFYDQAQTVSTSVNLVTQHLRSAL
jgi:uncharacterized protein